MSKEGAGNKLLQRTGRSDKFWGGITIISRRGDYHASEWSTSGGTDACTHMVINVDSRTVAFERAVSLEYQQPLFSAYSLLLHLGEYGNNPSTDYHMFINTYIMCEAKVT